MASVYVGFKENKGIVVPEQDAFDYAKDHLDEMDERDRREFVDWFFSGDFIKEEK